uniref:RPN13_C domain-containing protein n=1 Tax=Angiostrongylus cantonensis TaxID=6313 RepID=A0A0K0DBL6_ANGCA
MSLRIDDSSMFTSSLQLNGKTEDGVADTNGSSEAATNGGTPSPEATPNAFDIETQQKAFQRFTSSIGLGSFRSAFNMNVLPPFLAALQQNPFALQQQLLGLTGGLSDVSPGSDDDEDIEHSAMTEPEDLTLSFRKDAKLDDHHDSGASLGGGSSWSYEEQFKQLVELALILCEFLVRLKKLT